MTTHTVAQGAVRLHVRDEGPERGTPILLLSGLGMSEAAWDAVAARLVEAGHRVLRHDTRGHGFSDAPDTGYRLADLTADALAVLDALDVPRAHLAGHSLGGMVAVQLALARPKRVASVALLGALIAGQRPPPAFRAWASGVLGLLDNGLPALLEGLPDTAALRHRIADPAVAAALRRQLTTTLRAPAFVPENFADVPVVAATSPSPWERVRRGELAVPLLTLDGADDPVVSGIAEPAGTHVPGGRAVALPGAGHLALLEHPDAVAAELLGFAESVEQARGSTTTGAAQDRSAGRCGGDRQLPRWPP